MARPHRTFVISLLALALALGCQKSIEDQLAEARLQQEIGSVKESIDTLRAVIDREPEHPEANYMLGTAQLRMGQPALAIWPLEISLASPDWTVKSNLALGAAYLQLNQVDQAREAADRVLAANPEDVQERAGALRLRASLHMDQQDWEAALADTDQILTFLPEDGEALVLRARSLQNLERYEEARAAYDEIWAMPSLANTGMGARAGVGLAELYSDQLKDEDKAAAQVKALVERFPTHRDVLSYTVGFFVSRGQPQRATSLLRAALEQEPADVGLRSILSDHLLAQGDPVEAEELLREATDLLETPEAWLTYSRFLRQQGKPDEALVAMERTIELLPGVTDFMRFQHAAALEEAGELDRAEAVANEIEADVYRNVIKGKLAFERNQPAEALDLFEKALREWPNNAAVRYLAGKAAMQLGRLERAVSEFREALRSEAGATDAPLELAWLQLSQGKPDAALFSANRVLATVTDHGTDRYQKALVLNARAMTALDRHDEALVTIESIADPRTAALERALVAADKDGPAAALRVLEKAALDLTDPANEAVLRAVGEQLVATGRAKEALARVDGAIASNGDVASFHDVRGRVLLQLERPADAKAAFERAVELDADLAPALEGLAHVARLAGDRSAAVAFLDRAAEADARNATYPYQAAQIELAAGRTAEAERRLDETLRRNPVHPHACNDLAWLLADAGRDLDRALALALRARQGDPSATVLDTLGYVQQKRGDTAAAIVAYEEARALDPGSPSIAYRLGVALTEAGEDDRARGMFEAALRADAFPEVEDARKRLAALDATP